MRKGIIVAAAAAGLLMLAGCDTGTPAGRVAEQPSAAPAPRPHVIFISIDTLRADHLSCYGYERATTPSLDALAATGVRFAQAYAQASWTLPSHMSMMTAQYPHVHGVEHNNESLSEDGTTIAETLREQGYDTAAFVSWIFVSARYGFAQGFEHFAELLPASDLIDEATAASFKAEEVTDRASRWLTARQTEKPLFLFVHYFDPHIDYAPPEPFDRSFRDPPPDPKKGTFDWLSQYIIGIPKEPKRIAPADLEEVKALYDAEIRYTDHYVGQLFATIERTLGLDNCLIIVTSDHGEELDDHGSMEGHQWTLYEECVHVPLIVRPPGGIEGGRVVEELVELIDLAPTIVEGLSLSPPSAFQGRSLAPKLARGSGGADDAERTVFGRIDRHARKLFVRSGRYKLIQTEAGGSKKRGPRALAGIELFDLVADAGEQQNLYQEGHPAAVPLLAALDQLRRAQPATTANPGVKLSEAELKRLKSIGYIGSDSPQEP